MKKTNNDIPQIEVQFSNGKTIMAPAKGKVLKHDLEISEDQKDELFRKNMNATIHVSDVDFDEIKRLHRKNMEYYKTLPKWFNYNVKGEIVNDYRTYYEFSNSFRKQRRNKRKK